MRPNLKLKLNQTDMDNLKQDRTEGFNNGRSLQPVLVAVNSFALEREQINPFVKPTNKHGNNGGVGMSGRMPTRWKAIKFIDNATQDQALKQFSCYKEPGFRIVNYDTGDCIFDGGSRF